MRKRVEAASDVESADRVLSVDFGRRGRTEPTATVALSQPQRERLDHYTSSRHSHSPALGSQSGRASELRLHLMWRAP